MTIARNLTQRVQQWVRDRPKLDMEESVTWFLLVFLWAHGLTIDELDFEFSGIFPRPSTSLVVLVVILFCLLMAVMLVMEPLLPHKLRRWTRVFRYSGWYQGVRLGSIVPGFVLGWITGFTMIITTVPELWWLINAIFFIGFGIFLVLLVRTSFGFGLNQKPCQPEKR